MSDTTIQVRAVQAADLVALLALEQQSFHSDRLSKRQFQYWLKAQQRVFLVAEHQQQIVGYGLVIMRKGTRLARLYSIAVSAQARGLGVGRRLLLDLEAETIRHGKLLMRLEVAKNNEAAISLYRSLGYKVFGTYVDYYEDHTDALRMQKPIKQQESLRRLAPYPWYQQTTEFTCGPASLMMAMASLNDALHLEQTMELDIWREATTIFMTSGHGGSHPIGLGLSAKLRGFNATVYMNQNVPLFLSGVRNENKKQVLATVERQFVDKANEAGIPIEYSDCSVDTIRSALDAGGAVVCLISTYHFDGAKAPHWVVVTDIDDDCLYLHDPDVDELHEAPLDCQHVPIAIEDFNKLASYGSSKLRTAVIVTPC